MKYIYLSVFSHEIERYLNLLKESDRYIAKIQTALRNLDKYLSLNNSTSRELSAETILEWAKTLKVGGITKAAYIIDARGFVKYLNSIGITADCCEIPKIQSNYVPYVFSDDEIDRIIAVADNFAVRNRPTRAAKIFPILLRVLYGCGLRSGEGRSLRWKDVDFENKVLTVREAKNLKQRFVPMSDSMATLLMNYRDMTSYDGICNDYLFESDCNPDNYFRNNSFSEWFRKVLHAAGINYAKHHNRERGPCPHCLRHSFVLRSFLKSQDEGRRFEDTAPFLSAYLGHDSTKGTEKYLSSNHTVYTQSHKRVDEAIGYLFPEVSFDED